MALPPAFIRWTPEREAQIQRRMLDVLERRFRRTLARAIAEDMRMMSDHYALLRGLPLDATASKQRMRDLYMQLAETSARTFGRRIVTQGKALGYDLELKQEDDGGFAAFFRALAEQWISQEAIRQRIVGIVRTTRDQVTSVVQQGQRDGLGVDAIARRINERTPGISRWRGALIARTETHGAANFAMHETAKSTGLDLVKEWVSVEDGRTRSIARDDAFDHVAMNGQRRPMDDPFDMPWVGGVGDPIKIMFPGQAGLPGGATINCRCAVVHRVQRD